MNVVQAAGGSWPYIGWALFALALLLPFVVFSSSAGVGLWLLSVLLLFVWWMIDVTSQMVPLWMVLVGIAMIAIGVFQRLLLIACWAIYWTKVRE